ncbi:MAG: sugar transferase [Chloroflexi bacterium]|nr:sugar transferase [Chloroflexota bacterium]MDL1941500.1 sugar transferase [Chloroflexi bacterium CFX2]NOH02958.1 sugar transferase [Chloroflexota bacterium]
MTGNDYQWVKRFDPAKRIFVGEAYIRAKRIMDLTLILLAAPIWVPLFLLIALAIFISSPGAPVLYTNKRAGRGGKTFLFYKFRTMVPNADALKEKYMHLNELQWPDFKITNDPRVTPIGRFLRRTSLDELPQLLNVIKGEMSLVGPRPTDFGPDAYNLWHTERLDILPGVTGLWQITARGSVNMDERTRMDIAYIEHACIQLDLLILLKTVVAVFKPSGVT